MWVFIILFFFTIQTGCTTMGTPNMTEKALCMKINWQIVSEQNSKAMLSNIVDSIIYIKRTNLSIYLVPHIIEYKKIRVSKNNEFISDSLLGKSINFKAFIYDSKDLSGFKFDSLTAKTGSKFNVDSFLTAKTFKGMESYNEKNDSILEKLYLGKDRQFVEKYAPKIKYENSFDSTYFFFTKDKLETSISFSTLLEKKRKAKLYKLVGIYNQIPIGKYSFVIPRREMIWELKMIDFPYKHQIDNLINIFRNLAH